mgnify:CR=1 FL=1
MEPEEAFPYKAPDALTKKKYAKIFEIKETLKPRLFKLLFDKLASSIILIIASPILILIKVAYLVEGLIIPENSGPMFFFYNAVSGGKIIKKYKIRLIKSSFIDPELAKLNDWKAYSKEWSPKSRTYVGTFVKKFYLDELPQFYSILKGDMSFVGPRPLAIIHYERDLAQGNVTRRLLKGGMLGLGHINKGTTEMGNPIYEYEYLDKYISLSSFELLCLDLLIIWRGIILVLKGGGY